MKKPDFKFWPWLVLIAVLTLGAATGLFRQPEWVPGATVGYKWNCTNVNGMGTWDDGLFLDAAESDFYILAEGSGTMLISNTSRGVLMKFDASLPTSYWQLPIGLDAAAGIAASVINITNKVTYQNLVVSGAGNGNTNYTLLAGRTMYLGSSNVNISAAMDYDAVTTTEFSSVSITNLSALDWGLSFSAVTNRWFFSGVYGTNAPTVLTNNTRLEISIKHKGSNSWVGYTYYRPAQ